MGFMSDFGHILDFHFRDTLNTGFTVKCGGVIVQRKTIDYPYGVQLKTIDYPFPRGVCNHVSRPHLWQMDEFISKKQTLENNCEQYNLYPSFRNSLVPSSAVRKSFSDTCNKFSNALPADGWALIRNITCQVFLFETRAFGNLGYAFSSCVITNNPPSIRW
uniref:Uncharacterized protein n=1 Tax=Trichuris muris TaxID=70415 RepID=A0A5S6QAQ1_TRIMR